LTSLALIDTRTYLRGMESQLLIKRYARGRLYQPAEARYVSVQELRRWRRDKVSFVVRDAKTDVDVTRTVLTHDA